MSKELLSAAAPDFTASQLDQLDAAGIDFSKLIALVTTLGPKVVPLIQLWLATMPQTGWIPIVEALLSALFSPVPAPK